MIDTSAHRLGKGVSDSYKKSHTFLDESVKNVLIFANEFRTCLDLDVSVEKVGRKVWFTNFKFD